MTNGFGIEDLSLAQGKLAKQLPALQGLGPEMGPEQPAQQGARLPLLDGIQGLTSRQGLQCGTGNGDRRLSGQGGSRCLPRLYDIGPAGLYGQTGLPNESEAGGVTQLLQEPQLELPQDGLQVPLA
jgi:hypothetical protein